MLVRHRPTSGRRRGVTLAAMAAAGSLLITTPAMGGPSDDKRRVDSELVQAGAALESATARAQQAGAAYLQANRRLPGAQRAVEESRGEVAAAQVRSNEAARAARHARRQLAAAQSRLDATERQVSAERARLSTLVRASYEGGPFLATSAMMGARSPDQLIAGLNYLDSLAGNQRRAIDRVTRGRLVAAQQRAGVAARKEAADVADTRARDALTGARNAVAAAELARQNVVQLVNIRKNALQVAQQEKAANARQYAALQAESQRIAAALREAARRARANAGGLRPRNQPPVQSQPSGGGQLSRPVNGWKSSDFGWRYDPYYQVWQLHAGTDFAAARGVPILAAADGVVARAGWNGGYGNYTCIYHHDLANGRGLSTCYAHQSSIIVHVGDSVRRGAVIGRVGTTGASTGNHLHFEVRIDGRPVNPLPWLGM